jgi:hypothetical protein
MTERDAKIRAKIRAADGASFEVNGAFEDRVAFAVYMLLCDWGTGKKPRKKALKEFDQATRDYLEAAQKFKDTH